MTLIRILREIRPIMTDKICIQIENGRVRSHFCGDSFKGLPRDGWINKTKIPVVNWEEFTEQAPIFNYSLAGGIISYATKTTWEAL